MIILILIYVFENSPIKAYVNSSLFNYFIKPTIWFGVAIIAWNLPRTRSKAKLRFKNMLNFWALNFAIIYIIVSVSAGFIDGFGRSPYSRTPKGMLMNILFVGSALVGREFLRNIIVNNATKDEENYLVFVLISLSFTITSISLSRYLGLTSFDGTVKFIAQYFAPEFAHNLLATYLSLLGGPITSIIYLSIIQGFHWLSPILPNLKWITAALIGVLCLIFCMMSMQSMYIGMTKRLKEREKEKDSPLGWMITSVISIGIIWFSVGVFPIYPSVIATGSMEPMLKPGDVILVRKIVDMEGINNLKVGDVIQFKRDDILISHRIIEIDNDRKEGIRFRTKGDNNTAADSDLVKPEQIKGTIEYVVPKIGWPTLLIKSNRDIPLEEIVF